MHSSAVPARAKLAYIPSEAFSLKAHPGFDESWLEKQIVEHPEILELGTTKVARAQALQKSGGRVDLLLKDEDNEIFYTAELMLGPVDASHIVRTIDYFLRERTRTDWKAMTVCVFVCCPTNFSNIVNCSSSCSSKAIESGSSRLKSNSSTKPS